MRGGSTFLMLLTAFVLGTVVVAEVRYGAMDALALAFGAEVSTAPAPAAPQRVELARSASVRPLPALAAMGETRDRPLFFEYRQRPKPATVVQSPAKSVPQARVHLPPVSELKLSAVVIEDDERVALVRESGSTDTKHLRLRDAIGGWVVKEIRADGVVLSANGKQEALKLWTYTPATVPAAAAAAASTARRREVDRRRTANRNRQTVATRRAVVSAAERARARSRASPSAPAAAVGSSARPEPRCGLSRC